LFPNERLGKGGLSRTWQSDEDEEDLWFPESFLLWSTRFLENMTYPLNTLPFL
jgi:hypothetical protein